MIRWLLILFSLNSLSISRVSEFEKNEERVFFNNKKILILSAERRAMQSSISSKEENIERYENLLNDIHKMLKRLSGQSTDNQNQRMNVESEIISLYERYLVDGPFLSQEEKNERQKEIDKSLILIRQIDEEKVFIEDQVSRNKKILAQTNIELREVRIIISNLLSQIDNRGRNIKIEEENKSRVLDRQKYLISRIDLREKKVVGKAEKETRLVLNHPVKAILNSQKIDNGIRFNSSSSEVMASEGGEIIYSDQLHSYGHVYIIKHENNLKSIYLGEFIPLVEVGKRVHKGEKIAEFDNPLQQSVYFELRRGKSYIKNIKWNKASL